MRQAGQRHKRWHHLSHAATAVAAVLAVLAGVLFGLAGMGSSSAAVTLPLLGPDLGVTPGLAAWTISLYVLMLAVTTAVYGRVSDLVGVRAPLLAGLVLMSVGALVAALAPAEVVGPADAEITELAYDSATVAPGHLFFCVSGERRDGHGFGRDAVERGAAALVVERTLHLPRPVPQVVVAEAREAMAMMERREHFGKIVLKP